MPIRKVAVFPAWMEPRMLAASVAWSLSPQGDTGLYSISAAKNGFRNMTYLGEAYTLAFDICDLRSL